MNEILAYLLGKHPEYLYYFAMVVMFVLARFNPLALLVLAVWVMNQLTARMDFDERTVLGLRIAGDIVGFGLALLIVKLYCSSAWCFAGAILFLPMIALGYIDARGALHPYYVFWWGYWLAMGQAAVVMLGTPWGAVGEAIKGVHRQWRERHIDHILKLMGVRRC